MAGGLMSGKRRRNFARIFGAPQLGMLPLQRQDQGLNLERQPVRLTIRAAASIRQAIWVSPKCRKVLPMCPE